MVSLIIEGVRRNFGTSSVGMYTVTMPEGRGLRAAPVVKVEHRRSAHIAFRLPHQYYGGGWTPCASLLAVSRGGLIVGSRSRPYGACWLASEQGLLGERGHA